MKAISKRKILVYFLFNTLALFIFGTSTSLCQSKANEVYKRVSPAVVLIGTDKGSGTGFIIDSSGIIVTALHVVDSASKVAIKIQSGDVFDDVSLLLKDERKDIAILKINGFGLPAINLGNSNNVNPGDQVIVIGNPLGTELLKTSISDGIVSGIRDLGNGYKIIQITAPVSPGNSGGPALSINGEVIGIVVFRIREGESLNFAVPINYVRGMLNSISVTNPIKQWQNKPGSGSVIPEKSSINNTITRWKSLSSGTTKIIRIEGDYIYVETLESEHNRKLGVFSIFEFKKQGNKYTGTVRFKIVWEEANMSCIIEKPVELISVTPTRIEGQIFNSPDNSKFDWKKCKYSKPPKWESFVWIPE